MSARNSVLSKALKKTYQKVLLGQTQEPIQNTRRDFVKNAARLALGFPIVGLGCYKYQSQAKQKEKIAIIGGGIAGLSTAYHLKNAGIKSTIYEASERTGGRISTVENLMGQGLTTEMGGEYINSDHYDMLRFVKTFGLELTDLNEDKHLQDRIAFVDNKFFTQEEITQEFAPFVARMQKDVESLSDSPGYSRFNNFDKKFDRMSIAEYLEGIGITGSLYKIFDAAYTSEMATDIGNQSALNMLTFMFNDQLKYDDSDERYKVKGGSQKITDALSKVLENDIEKGYPLSAIRSSGEGYKLSFENGKEIKADAIIMTIPFAKLRQVDIGIDLPPQKLKAISNLYQAPGSKIHLGFHDRFWRTAGSSGYIFSDKFQNSFDSSQGQNNNAGPGSLSFLIGGEMGKNNTLENGKKFLSNIDAIFPDAKQLFNGNVYCRNWANDPFALGTYACYTVGQWTSIAGAEGPPVKKMFFAGEHTSSEYQGYMNGGAETGRLAAEQILAKFFI